MNEVIDKLKSINREGLTEREFYTQVLSILDNVNTYSLKSEDRKEIGTVLRELGCITVDDWRKEQSLSGKPVDEYFDVYKGVKNASIFEAINMVSQFLKDDNSYFLEIMKFGTNGSWAKEWLERNRIINGPAVEVSELASRIRGVKESFKGERDFYEEILKQLTLTKHMKDMFFESYTEIVNALRDSGAVTLDEWKEKRRAEGKDDFTFPEEELRIGIEVADVGTAVKIVSDFMKSYDDAVRVSNEVLAGPNPLTMRWVNNSEEIRQSNLQMYITMQDLLRINKDDMTERAFYERVIEVLANNPTTFLSRESYDELKEVLENIGVESYDDWKKKDNVSIERIVDGLYKEKNGGTYNGELEEGVKYVSPILEDYSSARMVFDYLRGDGRFDALTWVNDSREVGAKQKSIGNIINKMGVRQQLLKRYNQINIEQEKVK